jgi:hypothetical protein
VACQCGVAVSNCLYSRSIFVPGISVSAFITPDGVRNAKTPMPTANKGSWTRQHHKNSLANVLRINMFTGKFKDSTTNITK